MALLRNVYNFLGLGLILWHNLRQGVMGDNIKMDLPEMGWGTYWIDLAQNRDSSRAVVNALTNLRVP